MAELKTVTAHKLLVLLGPSPTGRLSLPLLSPQLLPWSRMISGVQRMTLLPYPA